MAEAVGAPVAPEAQPTQTQTPPPEPPKAPVAPAEQPRDWAAEYKRLEADHSRKVREHIIERRKWEADKKTTGERLSKLSELEKREQSARLNPTAFAQSVWGENWHEVLTEAKVHGVPPADLIAAELAKVREEFEAKLSARETDAQRRAEQAQQQQLEQARAGMREEAASWLAANAKEYPVLERLGPAQSVAKKIAERIEHEYHRSRRDESGAIVRPGRILTSQEAADLIERDLLAIAEAAAAAPKYRDRLAPKLAPLPSQPPSSSVQGAQSQQSDKQQSNQSRQQPRETLNNNIGARTAGQAQLTPAERRARAEAAIEAAAARRAAT
jgi:hypothetical protein